MEEAITGYHETRFAPDTRRDVLWKTLVEAHFQRLIPEDSCVLELGAGYAHFINQVCCQRRIAIDVWEGMPKHAAPGVEAMVQSACDLSGIEDGILRSHRTWWSI
jgi:hypothetical protein